MMVAVEPRSASLPAAAGTGVPGRGGEQPQAQPLGLQLRAWCSARVRVCIQAVSSQASATMAHQIWFWAKSCSGRLASLVSFTARIRPSAWARLRCRNSRSANRPRLVLVTNAVKRLAESGQKSD